MKKHARSCFQCVPPQQTETARKFLFYEEWLNDQSDEKLWDQCHYSGGFLGHAHSHCTLKRMILNFMPIQLWLYYFCNQLHKFGQYTWIAIRISMDEKYTNLSIGVPLKKSKQSWKYENKIRKPKVRGLFSVHGAFLRETGGIFSWRHFLLPRQPNGGRTHWKIGFTLWKMGFSIYFFRWKPKVQKKKTSTNRLLPEFVLKRWTECHVWIIKKRLQCFWHFQMAGFSIKRFKIK